jgi:hypothetical protein
VALAILTPMVALVPKAVPRLNEVSLDGRILANGMIRDLQGCTRLRLFPCWYRRGEDSEKSIPALQAADLISVIHARRAMNKDNFVQVAPALKEFYRHLRTSDYLPYVRLREISERVRRLITVRETPPGQKSGFYFASDMDKPRKKFGK